MATELTWLGHGSWLIEIDGVKILLDPFLDENPASPIKADDVHADYILVSHGHFDHVADVASIANRTGATVVAIYEIAEWFASQHQVQNTLGMNLGGGVNLPFGRVKMTLALHSSRLPDGANGGSPCGFVLSLKDGNIYLACDTGLFGDMSLLRSDRIDLAILPIGDLFTMGISDSIRAIDLVRPKRVIPDHYNTWPPIEQDAAAWAHRVRDETTSQPLVLQPGEKVQL